jgi:hypothetical protein
MKHKDNGELTPGATGLRPKDMHFQVTQENGNKQNTALQN